MISLSSNTISVPQMQLQVIDNDCYPFEKCYYRKLYENGVINRGWS